MPNNNNGDEDNIEGIAGDHAARYPFDDPEACRELHRQTWLHVELHLANRAARQARLREEDERIERNIFDD